MSSLSTVIETSWLDLRRLQTLNNVQQELSERANSANGNSQQRTTRALRERKLRQWKHSTTYNKSSQSAQTPQMETVNNVQQTKIINSYLSQYHS